MSRKKLQCLVGCIAANDVVGSTVKEVGKQFHKVFMVDDIKKEIMTKLGALEKRIDSESVKISLALELQSSLRCSKVNKTQ